MKKYTWLLSLLIVTIIYLILVKFLNIRIDHHVFGPLISGAMLGFGTVYVEKSLSKYFLKKEKRSYY